MAENIGRGGRELAYFDLVVSRYLSRAVPSEALKPCLLYNIERTISFLLGCFIRISKFEIRNFLQHVEF